MKTKKENFENVENKAFYELKTEELLKIKGGTEKKGGTAVARDGIFD